MKKTAPKPKLNPAGLPAGSGSIAKRGNIYWLYYADASGVARRESANTSDYAEARRRLAQHATETLEAQLVVVRGALHEAAADGKASRSGKSVSGRVGGPDRVRAKRSRASGPAGRK